MRPDETPTAGIPAEAPVQEPAVPTSRATKFCSRCGGKIDAEAVVCPLCGCQVGQMAAAAPNIVINNANTNTNTQTQAAVIPGLRPKNKWVALLLCFFLGWLGAHKFYEGKLGMGILYLLTFGLFGVGIVVDLIALLFKPNPYYI